MRFPTPRLRFNAMICLGVLTGAALPAMAAPTPFYEFTFNETGTTVTNTGSVDADGTMYNAAGTATDLHTADGGGVSGLPGDRAFDNTASTGMGNTGTGGRVSLSAPVSLDGAGAITIAGWFKTAGDTPIGSAAYLVDLGTSGGARAGITISGGSAASLRITVYGQGAGTSTFLDSAANTFAETEEWIFIAATYDSTVTDGPTLKLYKGASENNVALVASSTSNVGPVAMTALKEIAIGNVSAAGIRPFDGWIDELRVYDSALSETELETLRSSAIPEPASAALIAAGGLLALGRRRHVVK